jgi:hypothetical protein
VETGLHAVGVGVRALGVVSVFAVFVVLLAYSVLVFGIVVVQGVGSFGH